MNEVSFESVMFDKFLPLEFQLFSLEVELVEEVFERTFVQVMPLRNGLGKLSLRMGLVVTGNGDLKTVVMYLSKLD